MSEEREDLTEKQKLFCQAYLDNNFNATKAAIAAGYSKTTAKEMGYENLTKPHLREEIDRLAKEQTISADETVKLISDIAKFDIKDYLITRKVERSDRVKKPLIDIIQEVKDQISFEEEFVRRVPITDKEAQKSYDKMIASLNAKVVRLEIELERNPKAHRIVHGETKLVDEVELDLVKLKKDKESGRIKSFKYGKYGIEVEFYSAADMAVNMARIYGKFKDNLNVEANVNGSISPENWLKLQEGK